MILEKILDNTAVFRIILLLLVPPLLIAAAIRIHKPAKGSDAKKRLTILAVCLAAAVLIDASVFFLLRHPDNVFEEIYFAMRDVDHPGQTKLSKADSFELYYADDIFMITAVNKQDTSDGYLTYTEVHCDNSVSVYCIFETKKLVFFRQPIRDGAWTMVVYDLRLNELSYSDSRGGSGDRDPFLDGILESWFGDLGNASKFSPENPGKYTDIGYREADPDLYEIFIR